MIRRFKAWRAAVAAWWRRDDDGEALVRARHEWGQ